MNQRLVRTPPAGLDNRDIKHARGVGTNNLSAEQDAQLSSNDAV